MFGWLKTITWDKIIGTYDIDPKRARGKKGR